MIGKDEVDILWIARFMEAYETANREDRTVDVIDYPGWRVSPIKSHERDRP